METGIHVGSRGGYSVNKRSIYELTLVVLAALACSAQMRGQIGGPPPTGTLRWWITATKKGQPVTDLSKEELHLWIGKQEQAISRLTFDPPGLLRVGLLIDISGSQADQWPSPAISLAPGFFKRVMRPGDQAFVMHFNERYYVDAQPTNDLRVLEEGLKRLAAVRSGGRTAIYDAIVAACSPAEGGEPARQALVVLTDGEDDASRNALDEAMAVVERTGTQLYFIGTGLEPPYIGTTTQGAMRMLRAMADATGGEFFPASKWHPMEPAFNSIAVRIRELYALEFQPVGVSLGKKGNRIQIRCSRPGVKVLAPEKY
jgi:VWFA-related protein